MYVNIDFLPIIADSLITAISNTSQWPEGFDDIDSVEHFVSDNLINGNEDSQQHTENSQTLTDG